MSYVRNVQHIVFSTKKREPIIKPEIREDLYSYIGGIIRELKGCLFAIGGTYDHIHLLVQMHQSIPLSDLVRDIKSGSSRWINEQKKVAGHFSWQKKYAAFSVSFSVEEKVKEYISNQVVHHRVVPFMEEFRLFLDKHGIEYDDKYMGE